MLRRRSVRDYFYEGIGNCEGCRVDHPSQRQHDYLMMEDDQKMWPYLDSALDKVSEAKVVETFMNSLRDLKQHCFAQRIVDFLNVKFLQL